MTPIRHTPSIIQTKSSSPLEDLPNEIIREIASYLPLNNVLSLLQSCTRFRDCSTLLFSGYRCGPSTTDKEFHALCKRPHFKNLTSLHLSKCELITNEGLKALAPSWVDRNFRALICAIALGSIFTLLLLTLNKDQKMTECLTLGACGLPGLRRMFRNKFKHISIPGLEALPLLTNLTSLNLSHCQQITDTGLSALAPLTNLTKLNLSHCSNITDTGLSALAPLTNLTSLNLAECWGINRYPDLRALEPLTSLTSLNLSKLIKLSPPRLITNPPLSNLRQLNLSECTAINDVYLATLTNLSSLILSHCRDITDTGLRTLTNLTSLNLSHCFTITDTGLRTLTKLTSLKLGRTDIRDRSLRAFASLRNLTRLDLTDCRWITDVGLAALAPLTNLTQLNLSDCTHITDAGVAPFIERGVEINRW